MKRKSAIAKLGLLLLLVVVSSCALKAIPSEYSALRVENVDETQLGNGKILIYNGADILHGVDNTARLNVWIDDKPLGQVRKKEYTIIDLPVGNYGFKLLHIDMFNMRSEHTVMITKETKIIRIEPTITSNKLTVTNTFPNNFAKYTNTLDRKK